MKSFEPRLDLFAICVEKFGRFVAFNVSLYSIPDLMARLWLDGVILRSET